MRPAHRLTRAGFTLVELLVSMVLLLIVGTALISLLTGVQRSTRTQTEVAALRGAIRSGMQIVSADLQEIEADSASGTSDITALSSTAMSYNGQRGLGVVCDVSLNELRIRSDSTWAGLHAPTTGTDGIYLFSEGSIDAAGDDDWLTLPIGGSVSTGVCAAGGAAWIVPVTLTGGQLATIVTPAPVRTYETMQLGVINQGGRDWLGLRSLSGGDATLLPVAGPLASGGLVISYFSTSGAVTTNPARVKTIVIALRGETERQVNNALNSALSRMTDTLTVRIQLRNAR